MAGLSVVLLADPVQIAWGIVADGIVVVHSSHSTKSVKHNRQQRFKVSVHLKYNFQKGIPTQVSEHNFTTPSPRSNAVLVDPY